MELVPVADEGAERAALATYRGPSGVSVRIVGDVVTTGFVLEVVTPRDGTRICQRALLDMAAAIGVRCEIVPEPGFACCQRP